MELEGCDLSGSGKEESIPARVSQRLVHRVGCGLVWGSARRVTLRSSGFQRRLWFGDIGSVPKKDNLEVLDSFKCVWLEEASLYTGLNGMDKSLTDPTHTWQKVGCRYNG